MGMGANNLIYIPTIHMYYFHNSSLFADAGIGFGRAGGSAFILHTHYTTLNRVQPSANPYSIDRLTSENKSEGVKVERF
jgi:hypothetical protein